jgi:hypothetical protein
MMISKILIITGLLAFSIVSYSQESESVVLDWESPKTLQKGEESIQVPSISGQFIDGKRPNFFFKHEIVSTAGGVKVEVVTTEAADPIELEYLASNNIEVGSLNCEARISKAGNKKFVVVNLFPFMRKRTNIVRIKEIRLVYTKGGGTFNVNQKDFAATSVLKSGSGTWYKIAVDKDGIYKIDKAFLLGLGIDVENLNPQHINIYGNGDGVLPELNSIPRTDDLAKNAIQVIGEADGSFDDNDYILFYGWGPHRWYANGTTDFHQKRHVYSDVSCYFININASETPLRIENVFESPAVATHTVSDYSYYDIHELDLVSLVNGGQRWYGELFDTQLSRTFTFNVPNINTSQPADFEVSIASNVNNSSGTSQTYSISGNTLFTAALPSSSDYGRSTHSFQYTTPSQVMPLLTTIVRNSPDVLTYMDRITLNARRNLVFTSTQFNFADLSSVGLGNVAQYTVQNVPSSGFVWEVTNRHVPWNVNGGFSGGDYNFKLDADSLRSFVVSNGVDFYTPTIISTAPITHQDLHALEQADYLIVTHKNFLSQANRLADLHRNNGLSVHVVTTEQVFNEFSSGMQDATAIRSFAKMFYDRAVTLPGTEPKYLLLFGDGTYDPKNRVPNNNNFVLTYQLNNSTNTEDHIGNMPSDDYFGMLDDADAISPSDLLDIGVGRLLISDAQMAKEQVDKIQHYMNNGSSLYSTATTHCSSDEYSSTFGDWRTKYVLIADDEEYNYFLMNDVEPQYNYVSDSLPEMNCEKIYLDAYPQVSTAGGERYPDVNQAIDSKIERGALVVNYVGHGGEVGVAEERVITVPQIQDWRNIDVLPLIVSATCEFTKFDDPDRVSAGEWASINPYGAAIALMTTTRSVYFTVNTNIGQAFIRNVFKRQPDLTPRTFGEIIASTKNAVGGNNKRSFTLIGDPALKIALPQLQIVTDSINGQDPALFNDTIKALSQVTIKGHIEDQLGNPLSSYNGVLYPTVLDKPKEQMTLSNDGVHSPQYTFYTQTNKVYSGKASIANGNFSFDFIVPKDINYSIDYGKISYYAENGFVDAFGYDTSFYMGGLDPNGINDTQGPSIDLFINDENFVDGGITDETPILIAKLFDESGINTVGNGIGHDLIGVVDGETGNPIVLNDFYSADLDSYQSGEIRYNFAALEPGVHTLTVKVWDVNNNSSEATIEFVVQEQENMALDHVLNYPNPFTTHTEFFFEHNQVCNQLEAQIQIFTISGKLVKTINEIVNTEGFRSEGIVWNGRDDFGDQIGKGVYVYRVKVTTPDGSSAEKTEKLVILK